MRKVLRWLGYALAAILLLALIFAAWVWIASARILARTHEAAPEQLNATPAQLADGARQARVLGCISCHGEGLRGRMMFDGGPFATVWAPNLTELAARASDQQLAQAIRQGIGHDGRALFVMPSSQYSHLSGGDVAALIGYIRSVPRGGERVSAIQWGPIGRYALATGGVQSMPELVEQARLRQPFDTGPEQAAGRRLASIGCSDCHGPDLTGGHPTPTDTAPDLTVAGAYDLAQFTTLMRTGVPPGGRDLGLMKQVAREDMSHLTDEEIGQLHAYLVARAERLQR
jgi:cytochrome c553